MKTLKVIKLKEQMATFILWKGCVICPFLITTLTNILLDNTNNKDKNVHKFASSAIRGEFLEREREKVKDIVLGYYIRVTYYP